MTAFEIVISIFTDDGDERTIWTSVEALRASGGLTMEIPEGGTLRVGHYPLATVSGRLEPKGG